jgi:hypothetical protein
VPQSAPPPWRNGRLGTGAAYFGWTRRDDVPDKKRCKPMNVGCSCRSLEYSSRSVPASGERVLTAKVRTESSVYAAKRANNNNSSSRPWQRPCGHRHPGRVRAGQGPTSFAQPFDWSRSLVSPMTAEEIAAVALAIHVRAVRDHRLSNAVDDLRPRI